MYVLYIECLCISITFFIGYNIYLFGHTKHAFSWQNGRASEYGTTQVHSTRSFDIIYVYYIYIY